MKTILYNTATNKPLTRNGRVLQFNDGYKVAGYENAPLTKDFVELTVVEEDRPAFDPTTHKLEKAEPIADVQNGTFTYGYNVVPLSAVELARNDWKHPSYPMRLVIDQSVIFSPTGAPFYAWFQLNGNPIELAGSNVHVWINEVQQQHQSTFNDLTTAGLLTIENRPTALD